MKVLSFLGLLILAIENADCKGYLTVIAPKSIQSNSEYRLSIAAAAISKPINVNVKLTYCVDQQAAKAVGFVNPQLVSIPDPSDLFCQSCGKNELYVNWQPLSDSIVLQNCISDSWDMENNVTLSSEKKVKSVVFQTENIAPGSYALEVTSLSSSLDFNEKTFLYRESYNFSVLIETDKPVYKPGDIIKIRVLVLDFKTHPIGVKAALTVAVSDASQNRVQIWNDVSTSQGVYSNEHEIEAKNDLNLGLWQVEVEYKDKIIKKTIEVNEFILPKFSVEVETSNCMHVRVKATYFNGKPVAGSAIIKATPILSCSGSWKKLSKPVIKTFKCVKNVEVVFKKIDFVNENFVMLLIEVSVQEKTTGAVVQGSDVIIPIKNTKLLTNGQHTNLLQAKLINEPNLHKNIKIKVISKEKLSNLFFYVVGRGRILLSKEVNLHDLQKKLIFVKPTSAMAPESQLVVYYISSNGAIVSDVVKLVFADQISKNFIELKVCNNKLKPGEKVKITIKTKPNSLVGLLAVDVRSKFKTGNDLTRDRIIQELKNYENFGEIPLETSLSKSFTQMVELGTFVVTNSDINGTSEHIVDEEVTQSRTHKTDEDSTESEESSRSHEDKIESKRNFFPETWLWRNIKTSCKEITEVTVKVPDSITTWQLTAFSINEHGLALTEQPILLTVSQKFFVSVSLPYSAVRGEKLVISVSVHNYFEALTHVKVKLHNKNNDFEVLEPGSVQKLLSNQHVVSTSFTIIPNRVGKITLEVTASSSDHDCDTVRRVLLVKPEGVTFKQQKKITIVVNNDQTLINNKLKIPENIVNGSLSTSFSVQGDTSSIVLNNLEQFFQPTSGNDSSSLIENAHSNLILLQYLQSTKQANDTIERLLEDSEKSYELQISKQCWDGGFGDSEQCHKKQCKIVQKHCHERHSRSAEFYSSEEHRHWQHRHRHHHSSEEHKQVHKRHRHHHSSEEHEQCLDACNFCSKNNYHSCNSIKCGLNPVSSTLLTRRVCFNMLFYNVNKDRTLPDKNVIDRAVRFLSRIQTCNGSFVDFDQNTASNGTSILFSSTYIVIMLTYLARVNLLIFDYNCTLSRGLEYLSNEFEKTDDLKILNRITVAFFLNDHPKKDIAKQRIDLQRKKFKGSLIWSDPATGKVDAVATGLGMFVNLAAGDLTSSILIGKRLVMDSQLSGQNLISYSSYFSTLALVATAVVPVDPNMIISLTSDQNFEKFIQLNKNSRSLVQKFNLPSYLNNFTVSANGIGMANFLFLSQYNLPRSVLSAQFMLHLNLFPTFGKGWTLQICTSFKPFSNMTQSKRATLEIDIPVGCAVTDNILTIDTSSKIKAFELAEDGRLLRVEVEGLESERFCFDVQFKRVTCVSIALPSRVVVYEKNNITFFAQQFYDQPLDDLVSEGQ